MKGEYCDLPWEELAQDRQTLVFYMSLVSLGLICDQLTAHGKNPETPVAVVSQGTLPEQRVVIGTLRSIAAQVETAQLAAPTLTIVGDVVKLRDQLSWRDQLCREDDLSER